MSNTQSAKSVKSQRAAVSGKSFGILDAVIAVLRDAEEEKRTGPTTKSPSGVGTEA